MRRHSMSSNQLVADYCHNPVVTERGRTPVSGTWPTVPVCESAATVEARQKHCNIQVNWTRVLMLRSVSLYIYLGRMQMSPGRPWRRLPAVPIQVVGTGVGLLHTTLLKSIRAHSISNVSQAIWYVRRKRTVDRKGIMSFWLACHQHTCETPFRVVQSVGWGQ